MTARRGGVAVACCLALCAGAAGAARRPTPGGRLRLAAGPVPAPARAWRADEVLAAALVHDTLYRLDPSGGPLPLLAASLPRTEEEGRVARIPLVSGLVFHDGAPLDAAAAAISLRRLLKDGGSPHRWLLADAESVRAEGGQLVLQLRRPLPDLAARLAAPPTAIVRRAGGRLVGCGPFAPTRNRQALEAFPRHPDGAPFLERLTLLPGARGEGEPQRFALGRLDVSRRGPLDPGVAATRHVGPWSDRVLLLVRPPGLSPRVEAAVSRPALVRFDPGPARAAAAPAGGAGRVARWPTRPLRLLVRDAPHLRSLAEALVLALSAAGARAVLDPLPQGELVRALLRRHGDLVLLERPPVVAAPALQREQVAALAGGAAVVPLLARAPRLWLRPSWHDLRFDPAGFPRLDDLWCVR